MKEFLGTFVICLVFCVVAAFLFAGLLASNIWIDIVAVSLLLAALVTVLVKHGSRIEELEKTISKLQNEKEEPFEN
ncbi:MAG: hypothetical protein EOM54_02645 [Clostridia bacterium]|nr:hypothetical protein [Clostridia bacterium]